MMKAVLITLLVATALPVSAQDFVAFDLTPSDVKRLSERNIARADALEQAERGGSRKDLAILRPLIDAQPLPIADARELAGRWRCRTIKIGGLLPLTPYGYFQCRIDGRGDRASFEKTTGSQRSAGDLLRLDDKAFVFRGVGYTDFVARKPYGQGPETDEVGLLYRIGRDRLRLELPAPHHESRYNVMEFLRAR